MKKLLMSISFLTMALHRRKNPNQFSILESLGYAIIDGECVQLAPRSMVTRFLMGYALWLPSPAKTNPVVTIETPDDYFFADSEDGASQPYPEIDDVTLQIIANINNYFEEHPTLISELYDRLRVDGSSDCTLPANEERPDERVISINGHGNGSEGNQSQTDSAPIGIRVHEDGQNG